MKRIGKYVSIMAFGFMIMAASDSPAAQILCKTGFPCPFVENIETNALDGWGIDYSYSSSGQWWARGPWGSGGADIGVNGDSVCSWKSGSIYEMFGNTFGSSGTEMPPESNFDGHCWCQMRNGGGFMGYSGPWIYFGTVNFMTTNSIFCRENCAEKCMNGARNDAAFRTAICPIEACDNTTVIADGACPEGYYAKCVGSAASGNAAGSYTITCSE